MSTSFYHQSPTHYYWAFLEATYSTKCPYYIQKGGCYSQQNISQGGTEGVKKKMDHVTLHGFLFEGIPGTIWIQSRNCILWTLTVITIKSDCTKLYFCYLNSHSNTWLSSSGPYPGLKRSPSHWSIHLKKSSIKSL